MQGIEHISQGVFAVPDALSRLELSAVIHGLPNLDQLVMNQVNALRLQNILLHHLSFKLDR